jgi:hypothetical protein
MNLQEIRQNFGKTRIMNLKNLRSSIKIAKALDKQGSFKASDLLFEKLAQYYVEQSVTKNPQVYLVEFDEMEDEFKEGDEWRQTKKPNKIPKEYFDLGGEADGQNIEGLLHGPDNVPGPAYIDPGNLSSSPSMAGDVDSFTFEATYQKNVDDGNAWKNRIPLR